jgi:serine/threonine-protein kinase
MQVGKYELIRELAVGGMAEVFLARTAGPMGFEKQLVLKRILPHMAKDPAFIQMFLSEATLAARLTHPNIVQIFDFGESDGTYFLAMEYIDGPTLRTLLMDAYQRQVALPPVVCARIIANACEGLAFAHDFRDPATRQPLGIVHRDISPDNILLSRQGAVKVADFGIAKATGQRHRTQTGIIKGKLAYMPPEQVRAQPIDRRVDVYALGVVFYELVTGQRPYEAPTDASLMQSILFEQPLPAVLRNPDLPEPVQNILRRAIAKEREQRYPDCLAFQADLEQFILSMGKPVTTQHIAQLVAQVSPPIEDAPLPPLPPGSPPLEATEIRPSSPSAPLPVELDRTAPRATVTPEPIPAAAVAPAALATPAAPARRTGRLRVALAGLVLLAGGGGVLHWRTEAPLSPAAPPAVATAPEPLPSPAPPERGAAAEQPVPEPPTPPEALGSAAPEPSAEPAAPAPSGTPGESAPPSAGEQGSKAESERVGIVQFDIKPNGVIFLEGKRLGATPLGPVEISAGTYNFKVINKRLKKQVNVRVEVKPDDVTYVTLDLRSDAGSLSGGMGPDSPTQ